MILKLNETTTQQKNHLGTNVNTFSFRFVIYKVQHLKDRVSKLKYSRGDFADQHRQ